MKAEGETMSDTAYDAIADQYALMVQSGLMDATSVLHTGTHTLLRVLGDPTDKDICDLACGEGHLSLLIAEKAHLVVGIDLSPKLIEIAEKKAPQSNIRYVVDDAQTLHSQRGDKFDVVICNFALMDIPDLDAVYKATYRVLRERGRFIFSITHPCFQSPHSDVQVDEEGQFKARRISIYANEGFWRSDNPKGIRGQVGAHHRMVSTYLNLAIRQGFTLSTLSEPTLPSSDYDSPYTKAQVEVPSVMVIELRK